MEIFKFTGVQAENMGIQKEEAYWTSSGSVDLSSPLEQNKGSFFLHFQNFFYTSKISLNFQKIL